MSETEWRPTGNDSIGEMRGHVGVTRREDVKRSFVVRNYRHGGRQRIVRDVLL